MKTNKSFFTWFFILFAIVSGISIYLKDLENPELIHSNIFYILGFYFVTMVLSHVISEKGLADRANFHMYYFGSMGVRFLLSLFFILINLYFLNSGHLLFVINFFILYLVFTSFEIYFLLLNLRIDSKNDGKVT